MNRCCISSCRWWCHKPGKRGKSGSLLLAHTDLEQTCKEKREDKERALSEIVLSLGLRDNAIYAGCEGKKLIFAINAKDPKEDDHQMGRR